ncbi:MAG: potassium-transporting ATPase subunit KdpC [Holophagales bacterium]|nr:MAG: potassium-transporting ATPase subunit KdpC [Holophagales bacterium]
MLSQTKPAILLLLVLTVLTGLLYPLGVTAFAQVFFPRQANGSLVTRDGRVVGSELVGQPFAAPEYFWGRPSATVPPYDAGASAGANLGPTNPALVERVAATVSALRAAHGEGPIPVDLATSSASGLDPHLSPAAALYQVPRVARARGLTVEAVRRLVEQQVEGRQLGFLGEPRVNVLRLNLALDAGAAGAVR